VVSFTYVQDKCAEGLVFSKFLKLTLIPGYRNDNRFVLCHFRRYERITYTQVAVLRVNICFHGSCYLYFYQMTGNCSAIRNGEKFWEATLIYW
jgi:hypothetical protein